MSDVGTVSLDAIGSFVGPASLRFYVAAFALEVVLFAAFVVTYTITACILIYRAHPQTRRRRSNVTLFAANTLMFIFEAAHLVLDIVAARQGFFHAMSGIEAAKFMIYVSQTLIGDGFMIYRVYSVYNRHWPVIIVPAVLLVVDGIIGYISTFLGIIGFYMSVGFYSMSLLINSICTVLIMWRVFRLTREFQGVYPRGSKLKIWKVIEATVQTTAIYSAASVSLVVTFVNSTAIGYPTCLNVFPALIGLVFSFIVLRVVLNSTRDDVRPDSQAHASDMSTGRQTAYLEHQPRPEVQQKILVSTVTTTTVTAADRVHGRRNLPKDTGSFGDVILITHDKVASGTSESLVFSDLGKEEGG